MHFASLIGLFKSTDSIIVILIIVDDLCFKQFLDVSTISNLKKLNLVFPFLLFLYFFFDESKSRDPEIGIFLRQLSSQKELDPTPEPSGNLALGVICCSISLFTCLDLFCYLICKACSNEFFPSLNRKKEVKFLPFERRPVFQGKAFLIGCIKCGVKSKTWYNFEVGKNAI